MVSTAGDALLSVADPSTNATGRLVNGAFSLPQPLQIRARYATTSPGPYFDVRSNGAPLNLFIWNAPVSNDLVNLEFSQLVNANDALRTGTYSKALTFTLELPPSSVRVHADADKLQTVLIALLSNAIKFTPTGGHIVLNTAARHESSGYVFVRVADTGSGVARTTVCSPPPEPKGRAAGGVSLPMTTSVGSVTAAPSAAPMSAATAMFAMLLLTPSPRSADAL